MKTVLAWVVAIVAVIGAGAGVEGSVGVVPAVASSTAQLSQGVNPVVEEGQLVVGECPFPFYQGSDGLPSC